MSDQKSNEIADSFRDKGSKEFSCGRLEHALKLMNTSLSYSESDANKSLSFFNRSAVYMELKLYTKCLENIQWARDHDYEKVDTLNEREKKCRELMKRQKATVDVAPVRYCLTYPANRKVPFIINALEMRVDKNFGRGIYTTRDLKSGDVIAIEEPFFKFMKDEAKFKRCANCLKSNKMNLLPSSGSVMFCSASCLDEARLKFGDQLDEMIADDLGNMQRFFKDLFGFAGDVQGLRSLIDESEGKTVFNFDLRQPNTAESKVNMLKCILNLRECEYSGIVDLTQMLNYAKDFAKTEEDEKIVEKIVHSQSLIVKNNSISFFNRDPISSKKVTDLAGIFPFGSLVNHSCDANVHVTPVDNKLAWIVAQPITKSDQITVNYGTDPNQSVFKRRRFLKENFGFTCNCIRCQKHPANPSHGQHSLFMQILLDMDEDSSDDERNTFDRRFKQPNMNSFKNVAAAMLELKKNYEYINKHHAKHPHSIELCTLKKRNANLLDFISGAAFLPA